MNRPERAVASEVADKARRAGHAAYIEATNLGFTARVVTDMVINGVFRSLHDDGVLDYEEQVDSDQLDVDARRLAKKSAFPRYTVGDGWQLVRYNPHHAQVAYRKAVSQLQPGQDALARELDRIQERLLASNEEA